MQRTSFADMPCPVGRALERVGDWWTILILREAFYGSTRFDEFQSVLQIAPNMLTRRLKQLVDDGLFERRLYHDKPPRYEYVLTPSGRDFRPVMLALMSWGNKHFAPEGPSVLLISDKTGKPIEPTMIDARDGTPISDLHASYVAGPAASESVRQRLARVREKLQQRSDQKGAR
jgi:DNA-binding HxlR family transcriptional regulator